VTLAEDQEAASAEHRKPGPGRSIPHQVSRYLALNRLSGIYSLGVLVLIFGLWTPQTFLTLTTVRVIAADQAVTAIAAIALVLPLAAGLYDLSIAANLGAAAALMLYLQLHGFSSLTAMLITLLGGVVVGIVNGLIVVLLEVNSFIATLGMSSILAAVAYWITGGNQLVGKPSSGWLGSIGYGSSLGVPNSAWAALGVALIFWYVTEWTTVGRYAYAIGARREAARLVGVRVNRIMWASLVCSGLVASAAGVLLTAELGSTSPDLGPPYLLPAFSAALLGATQIKANGRVNVFGTLVAIVLLATGIYGLQLVGAPGFVSDLFNGAALILSVTLAVQASRRDRRT
jgi:ribose transport system permease protein